MSDETVTRDAYASKNAVIVNTRQPEEYFVPHAKTDRLARSAIPYMARLLNASVKRMT